MTKLITLVNEHSVCSLPWIQAEVNFLTNEIKPCCRYTGKLGNLSDGLKTIWLSDAAASLRHRTADLEQIHECRLCNDPIGAVYRDFKNKQFKSLMSSVDSSDQPLPKIIHVIISDVCNLGCRMCDPTISTTLSTLISKSQNLHFFYPGYNQESSSTSVDFLNDSLSNVNVLMISGGEPLVSKDILPLIQRVKTDAINLRRINIITNMSKLNKPLLEELNSLASNVFLNFTISIDGPRTVHEYIRYNCSFDVMIENIRYIKDNYPRINFDSNSTISILNVGYIVDTLRTYQHIQDVTGIKFKNIICSEVNNPSHLKASNIPDKLKKLYLNKLSNKFSLELFNISGSQALFDNAIRLLNSADNQTEYNNFIRFINEFDNVADTNFLTTYPEFKNFIE